MRRHCEVCESLLSPEKLRATAPSECEFEFGARSVRLCRTHALLVRMAGAHSFEALTQVFREKHGRRSLVARRRSASESLLPERRSTQGRRARDNRAP